MLQNCLFDNKIHIESKIFVKFNLKYKNSFKIVMKPLQIKIEDKKSLLIKWDANSTSKIGLKYLRDECPCANCKGETILLKTYRPPKPTMLNPEMYKIQNIQPVGGYAIQISWKDDHNTGIYSWEYLKKLAKDESSGQSQEYDKLL